MELIVALTITGFMAAVGTATFSSIIDSKRIVKESTMNTERAAALREAIRTWLLPASIQIQQGTPPRGNSGNGRGGTLTASTKTPNGAETVTAAVANGDEVTFTTTAPNPANAPDARMRLFVDTDEATPEHGLTLEYQVNQQAPLQRRELDSLITSMTVEYLDQRTRQWFRSGTVSTATQPLAIRITLTPANNSKEPPLMEYPMVFAITRSTITQFGSGGAISSSTVRR